MPPPVVVTRTREKKGEENGALIYTCIYMYVQKARENEFVN